VRIASLARLGLLLLLAMAVACSASVELNRAETSANAESVQSETPPDDPADETGNDADEQGDAQPTPTAPALASGSAPVVGEPAQDRIVVANRAGQVYLIDPDGSDRLDLITDPTAEQGSQPVWSPDGRRIACHLDPTRLPRQRCPRNRVGTR